MPPSIVIVTNGALKNGACHSTHSKDGQEVGGRQGVGGMPEGEQRKLGAAAVVLHGATAEPHGATAKAVSVGFEKLDGRYMIISA